MASGKRENADHKDQMDAASLQCQNQKLVQQLEAEKSETHALEEKFKELKDAQSSYDTTLISVNKSWDQLVDDLVLLGIRAGADLNYLQALDHEELSTDALASCPPEEIFLYSLLQSGGVENSGQNELLKFVEEALASRRLRTVALMKHFEEAIAAQQARNEVLASALHGQLSSEDVIVALQNHNEHLKAVVENMHRAVDVIDQKQKRYMDEIEGFIASHSREQAEVKRLSGEVEESLAELEESRRKLVVLQIQKHGGSVMMDFSVANAVNGTISTDKTGDKGLDWQELKESIEEAKTLAGNRLFELHETQEDNLILSKQLDDLQDQLKDEKYVVSSKPYTLLNDQLQQINAELERYKGLVESLQNDRNKVAHKERELNANAESVDKLKQSLNNFESRIEELEHEMQKLITERNDLEIKVEEALQDSGKKDFKDEIHVMAAALSKEMELMENQLNRSKEAASEALSLREEANSLRTLLARKIVDHKSLSDKCAEQEAEIKSLKQQVESLEKEKQELYFVVDMYGQESHDTRTIIEINESENRARKQAEYLRNNLDEHSLELRVKAANEAEAACKLRLSIAEAEINDLRGKLDASERDALELKEAIRIKDAEGESYISEIETIGQAYEDMQAQNQHLLQQVADRDDFNIKLVSDSVKMKQTSGSLLSEKHLLQKQLQQVNASLESSKTKIGRDEEQMKTYIAQATKSSSENRHLVINLEKTMLELGDAEKELKWLRSNVGSFEKEHEQNQKKIAELREELVRERSDRKKLEEEYEEVKNEVMELTSENEEVTIQKLQDEIKDCKAILKCGVCFDRPKEVVITKCFHLFCSQCIQRNLEIRHRKCPGCGTPFGQNDVREVKI